MEEIEVSWALAGVLLLLVILLAFRLRARSSELSRANAALAEMREKAANHSARLEALGPMETRLADAQRESTELGAALAASKAGAEAERVASERRIADLVRVRGELEQSFRNLANEALGANRNAFLTLANETFGRHRSEATADLEARRKAVEDLVRPIGETLAQTRTKLETMEKERGEAFGKIREQLTHVGNEASRLTHALKSSPGTRGRWGEESLRNVLELAGLSSHCDFDMQVTFGEDERVRPDCVIRLPGGRHIVVDAKAGLEAYLEGCDLTEREAREACFNRHADAMRGHMRTLAAKEYWQYVSRELSVRPDFVAMYVPGENFFSAAIERRPDLFQEAIGKGVFIVTPTTLIALAKAIPLGWRQEAITQNAREVAQLGSELYKRMSVMGEHLVKVGKNLGETTTHYNRFIGSLEGSVMPQARRFKDLDIADGSRELAMLEPVEVEVREPERGRDLLFDGGAPMPAE